MAAMSKTVVYQTSCLDNIKEYRNILLSSTLYFNDVLEPEMLHAAFCKLLEMGDWRRLGGRVKKGRGRKLEIHVPGEFTQSQPAVTFTTESFSMRMREHPILKNFPRRTEQASLQSVGTEFLPVTQHPDSPRTTEDLIKRELPLSTVHVVVFSDATLVTISWPHMLVDGMSMSVIFRAWSSVLANKADQVPSLLGIDEDIAYSVGKPSENASPGWLMKDRVIAGWGFIVFVVLFLWRVLTDRGVRGRAIFLPSAQVAALKARAAQDIADRHGDKSENFWVSEGDILLAWVMKMVGQAQKSQWPINGMNAVSLRDRLPEMATSSDRKFVQNMTSTTMTYLPKEAIHEPLGLTAIRCREALTQQTEPSQLRAYLREMRSKWDAGSDSAILLGPPQANLVVMSNWTKMDLARAVDFAPAVVKEGVDGARHNPPGTLVLFAGNEVKTMPLARDIIIVQGKDWEGNYWLSGKFSSRVWAEIEREIENLQTPPGKL